MFAGPLGRSTFTPPKSSFDSPLYGLVSLRRSHAGQVAQAGGAESEFVLTGVGYEIDFFLLAALGVGVMIRLSWLAIGLARLRSYRKTAHGISPLPALIEKLPSLTGARAQICLSAQIQSPVTFGVSRPVILLPAGFLGMEEKHQEAIVCHELLHVRRSDWLFTLFEEAIRGFLWFHPAIWWVLGRIQLAREQLVDRQTIEITQAKKTLPRSAGSDGERQTAAASFGGPAVLSKTTPNPACSAHSQGISYV